MSSFKKKNNFAGQQGVQSVEFLSERDEIKDEDEEWYGKSPVHTKQLQTD